MASAPFGFSSLPGAEGKKEKRSKVEDEEEKRKKENSHQHTIKYEMHYNNNKYDDTLHL